MKKLLAITAIVSIFCTTTHGMTRFTRIFRPAIAAAVVMSTAQVVHTVENVKEYKYTTEEDREAFREGWRRGSLIKPSVDVVQSFDLSNSNYVDYRQERRFAYCLRGSISREKDKECFDRYGEARAQMRNIWNAVLEQCKEKQPSVYPSPIGSHPEFDSLEDIIKQECNGTGWVRGNIDRFNLLIGRLSSF